MSDGISEEEMASLMVLSKKVQSEKMYFYILNKKYGLSRDQYENQFKRQGGKCCICKSESPSRRLSVDHCHETKENRGLLCNACNTGLGYFKENAEALAAAAAYLTEAKQRQVRKGLRAAPIDNLAQ